jgi:hypothetical protein
MECSLNVDDGIMREFSKTKRIIYMIEIRIPEFGVHMHI